MNGPVLTLGGGMGSFEIVGTENDVAFVMINANPKSAQERLDGIIAKPRKFVCINDDIDHSAPESVETLAVRRPSSLPLVTIAQ